MFKNKNSSLMEKVKESFKNVFQFLQECADACAWVKKH